MLSSHALNALGTSLPDTQVIAAGGGTVSSWITAQVGDAKSAVLVIVGFLALIAIVTTWVRAKGAMAPLIVTAAAAVCFGWLAKNIDSPTIQDKVNNQANIGMEAPAPQSPGEWGGLR